jgi:hypothetical protein
MDDIAAVAAAHLPAPLRQRRHAHARVCPRQSFKNAGSGCVKDSSMRPRPPARRGDRGVGVGDQLWLDLVQIDAALREVLAVVAPADRADAQRRHRH